MYESNDKMVSHPDHYQSGNGLEVIDVIEAFTADLNGIEAVCVGNALKYICRYKKKNGAQDIKKSIWYLTRLLEKLEKKEEPVCDKPEEEKEITAEKSDATVSIKDGHTVIHVGDRDGFNNVLNTLKEIIDTYAYVSMADLKDLLGLPTLYSENSLGWTDVSGAWYVNGRMVLPLPKTIEDK